MFVTVAAELMKQLGHNANENLKMLCEHCAHIVEKEFPEVLVEGFED
ncbi:Isoleucyl-tRNA synthetase [Lactococcus cremoris subsp. cremoris A76]|nr:Isoleucyl-tRNA synthetase [Lactococcus cremoris subsp. cremoris A76]